MSIEMLQNIMKFEGHLIRDNGDVYENYFGRWVKVQRAYNTKTKRVEITFNNETFDLAELVYFAFKGCYDENWFELVFKDGNKRNCALSNLTIRPKDEKAYKEHIRQLSVERIKKEQEMQTQREKKKRREHREQRKVGAYYK